MSEPANTSTIMTPQAFIYPKYEYTFKVVSLSADQGCMLVDYLPKNPSLTKITLNLPILANFEPSKLEELVDSFAPNNKWFGQETILNYESILVGANSNISM